jgi:hypothetical protein
LDDLFILVRIAVGTLAPMDRHLLPRVMLALLTVLSLCAVVISLHTNGSGHRPKAYGAPSYGFAGYSDLATVNQISARWRVPFIASQPYFAAASTWIAAQSNDQHFIQLGTTENVTGFSRSFNVFWSDPVVHFEPQSLGVVAPGNLVTFSMVKIGTGWKLRFDDRTTSKSNQVTIHYGRTTTFNEGEWIQEDPTTPDVNVHYPYPHMSLVTFSRLQLDQQAPQLSFQYAQVMSSSNGVFLIPSKVRHNQFTFHRAKGATRQYLQDALLLSTAIFPFDNDAQDNVSPSSSTVDGLLSALRTNISELKTQPWPKATRSDIAGIVTNLTRLRRLVRQWPVAPATLAPQYYNELRGIDTSDETFVLDIHARLGIPPRD